jgi:hypothetical protein
VPVIVDSCFQSCKEAQVHGLYFTVPVRCPLSISCQFEESCEILHSREPRWQGGKYWAVDWCVELDKLLTKVRSLQTHAFYTGRYIL